MANILGDMLVRIVADTSNFNAAISKAEAQFDGLNDVLQTSAASIGEAFRRISGEAAVWGESTELIAQKQAALKKEISDLIAKGVDPLSPRIEKLQNQYYKLGEESQALANKQKPVLTSWQKFEGQLKALDSSLGGVGQKMLMLATNPLVLTATAIIAVGKAFTSATKDLMEYGEQITDLSQRTGLSTKALQEYKFVADQTGGSVEQIANSVKLMTRGLETNAETFQRLGISTKTANGQFRSANEIFDDTMAALGGVANETDRSKLALEIFGRDATSLIPLLKLGADGLQDMKNKARDLGLILSEKTIKNADDFKDSTDALGQAFKAFSMTLVQEAAPALNTVADALLYTVEILNRQKLADEQNKIIKAYLNGKATIIEYHDALKIMIDLNKEAAADEKNSAAVKTKALKEIQYCYQELDRVARAYGEAMRPVEARAAAAAKALADTEAYEKNKAAIDAQIEARKKATAAYDEELKNIKAYKTEGLLSLKDATEQTRAATEAYAKALLDAGYSATEDSIGGKALAKALADLRAAQIAANDATRKSIGLSEELSAVAIQEETEAEKRAAAWRSVTDSVNENIQAQEALRAVASSVFSQLGEDLANNEVSWKSLGTAAINSIGAIVYALGDELGAKAAARLVEAIAASLNPFTAWAAPGMYASAAKLGLGAAAAWTVGSMMKTVKLANGGLAYDPTLAVVGDNPRYPELVAPLSPEVMGMLADGLMMAFATRSRPAGVTETSVAQARNVTPYGGASRSISFAGATIIADDSGLRKLNRQLRRFGLQEDVRVGA